MRLLFLVGAVAGGVALVPLAAVTGDRRAVSLGTGVAAPDGRLVDEFEYLVGANPAALGATRERSRVQLNATIVGVIVAFFATGLLVGVYESCWTLLLRSRHVSTFEIGLSWTLFALPFAALSIPAGRLAGRMDRRRLAIGGLAASAVFCAIYPFLHSVAWLVGLGSLEAACSVIGAPAAVLILTEATSQSAQGEAQGLLETGRTAATVVSAAAAGGAVRHRSEDPVHLGGGAVAYRMCGDGVGVARRGAAIVASQGTEHRRCARDQRLDAGNSIGRRTRLARSIDSAGHSESSSGYGRRTWSRPGTHRHGWREAVRPDAGFTVWPLATRIPHWSNWSVHLSWEG